MGQSKKKRASKKEQAVRRLLLLVMCYAEQDRDPAAEANEVADAETDALEHPGFVAADFGTAVGIKHIKSVENVLAPVKKGSAAFAEFWEKRGHGT